MAGGGVLQGTGLVGSPTVMSRRFYMVIFKFFMHLLKKKTSKLLGCNRSVISDTYNNKEPSYDFGFISYLTYILTALLHVAG